MITYANFHVQLVQGGGQESDRRVKIRKNENILLIVRKNLTVLKVVKIIKKICIR